MKPSLDALLRAQKMMLRAMELLADSIERTTDKDLYDSIKFKQAREVMKQLAQDYSSYDRIVN